MKTLSLVGLLAAQIAGFTAVFAYLHTFHLDISPLVPDVKSVTAEVGNTQAGVTDGTTFADLTFPSTTQRPLFNRDRRKFVPPPPPKRAIPAKPTQVAKDAPRNKTNQPARTPAQVQFSLIGISISDGVASALLASKNGANRWVASGDSIQSWEISSIDSNSVHLTGNGQDLLLKLYESQEP